MTNIAKEQVDKVFAGATSSRDYILGLYRLAYGDNWSRVKLVIEWPSAGLLLYHYAMSKAVKFDTAHDVFIPGWNWMNKGFTKADEDDWSITIGKTEWVDD